jgi:hypothetical protein
VTSAGSCFNERFVAKATEVLNVHEPGEYLIMHVDAGTTTVSVIKRPAHGWSLQEFPRSDTSIVGVAQRPE